MAHSTSPSSPALEREASEAWASDPALLRVRRFYRWQAGLYDYTRPWLLRGRDELLERLPPRLDRVVDVGSGTGHALPGLLRRARSVIAVEPSAHMRRRAQRRVAALGASPRVSWDAQPYRGDSRLGLPHADAVVFSYSLSMIPAFEEAIDRAARELRSGGTLAAVDFVSAGLRPFGAFLTRCHVELGERRLERLRRVFPAHEASLRRGPLWTYFLFWGTR
jgi:S-adenosylmethionine-diacylgycerolhomoserine-N-methlytransferase